MSELIREPFHRKLRIVCFLAGLLTYSLAFTFPSRSQSGQWLNKIQDWYELTAAGTVSDLHRIPF